MRAIRPIIRPIRPAGPVEAICPIEAILPLASIRPIVPDLYQQRSPPPRRRGAPRFVDVPNSTRQNVLIPGSSTPRSGLSSLSPRRSLPCR
jgi:hypothetical protein